MVHIQLTVTAGWVLAGHLVTEALVSRGDELVTWLETVLTPDPSAGIKGGPREPFIAVLFLQALLCCGRPAGLCGADADSGLSGGTDVWDQSRATLLAKVLETVVRLFIGGNLDEVRLSDSLLYSPLPPFSPPLLPYSRVPLNLWVGG